MSREHWDYIVSHAIGCGSFGIETTPKRAKRSA